VLGWFVDSADMWRVIVSRFGNRWCGWLDSRARPDPARDPLDPARLSSLLPLTPQELGWTRVWLALVELGRTRPHLAHRIAWVEQRERELAARMLAQALSADSRAVGPHVDSTVALVWGLRHAVCAPVEAMPLECAHELLDAHVEGLRRALTQR
jgi:hypothetical protein